MESISRLTILRSAEGIFYSETREGIFFCRFEKSSRKDVCGHKRLKCVGVGITPNEKKTTTYRDVHARISLSTSNSVIINQPKKDWRKVCEARTQRNFSWQLELFVLIALDT